MLVRRWASIANGNPTLNNIIFSKYFVSCMAWHSLNTNKCKNMNYCITIGTMIFLHILGTVVEVYKIQKYAYYFV